MLMLMPRAFAGAGLAGEDACLDHRAQDRDIASRTPHGDTAGDSADVRAVEADTNALAHLPRFREAGIRTGGAQGCTEKRMARGSGEVFVQRLDVRMKGDHVVKRHLPVSSDAVGHEGLIAWRGGCSAALIHVIDMS
ncbi:hypothetical protein A8V01_24445 [Novosphingobium guangzhouense]|uniref:Uncharacterized protein n=1 Tax=Novosphingobium guangzhouense TaxID=1850347 RepID=A0A2K2FWR1_9SPHN|nr:hypothetical protein A8V01_24445 [Novosphingobium guangzhouense]